jgi:tetratricopeptide (TPR) repeat protein
VSPRCDNRVKRARIGIGLIAASAVLALLLGAPGGSAGAPLTIDPDRQFGLAEALFDGGDFSAAIIEYRRFLHFFPEDPRADTALYRIGQSHLGSGALSRAIDAFFDLIERFPQSRWYGPAYFAIADAHMHNNAPGLAAATLEDLIARSDDPDIVDEANYRIGWIRLETGDWERARRSFDRIRPEKREAYRLRQLSQELDKASAIPRKNPATAGLLGLIPGAGHAYVGRYRDALVALAVNAALIAAAVEAFDNDLPVLGGVITAVGLGFYTGSVYSAVSSAHKYNRAQERAFIENLKEIRPAIFLGASPAGVTAHLRISF